MRKMSLRSRGILWLNMWRSMRLPLAIKVIIVQAMLVPIKTSWEDTPADRSLAFERSCEPGQVIWEVLEEDLEIVEEGKVFCTLGLVVMVQL